ncbi:MAG TPA: hypothetical protein VD997_03420 [Phycisphaerales bacterium]|nr:hypothetical protein [Phycisphaerales bacterium]
MIRNWVLGVVVAMALLTGRAAGQTTLMETLAPALSRDDYKVVVARLELTKEQREAADRLYEGYLAEHARSVAAFKQGWKEWNKAAVWVDGQQQASPEAVKALEETNTRYHERKPGAQKEFLRDLKSMLEESQAGDKWERVERHVRRQYMDSLLWRSPVEWHRVDLVRGVLLLELPAEEFAKVRGLVDEYELLIDKPLRRMEAVAGQKGEDAQRVWLEGALELRAINRRHLRLVLQELPEAPAARLKRWAHDRAYWDLSFWAETSTHIGAADARKLDSLTKEQEAQIAALLAEIDKRVMELRAQAEKAYEEADEKMMRMSEREYKEAMERPDNPLVLATGEWGQKHDEIYSGSEPRLEAILTMEQRKELWPPNGSLREAMIARSRKRWE